MDKIPYFSVVIPAYNAESTITSTIRSVLEQNLQDFEIIVIDDGSTDCTAECATIVGDPRVSVYKIKNSGVSTARNTGIAHARGKCIAFLDADDIWKRNHLDFAKRFFEEHPSVEWYASRYCICSPDVVETKRNETSTYDVLVANYLLGHRDSVSSSSVVLKREVLDSIDLFPDGVRYFEDIIAWARLSAKSPNFGYQKETTVLYIRHECSFTGRYVSRSKYVTDYSHFLAYVADLQRLSSIYPGNKLFLSFTRKQILLYFLHCFKKNSDVSLENILQNYGHCFHYFIYVWLRGALWLCNFIKLVAIFPFMFLMNLKKVIVYRKSK